MKNTAQYFFLPLTALLGFSSHTMLFTHFKCTTSQWFLAYSQGCAVTTIIILEHFHHTKKKPYAPKPSSPPPSWVTTPNSSAAPSSWQPLIYFQSIDLPILDSSWKWNRAVGHLLWLASFTLPNFFKVHTVGSTYHAWQFEN